VCTLTRRLTLKIGKAFSYFSFFGLVSLIFNPHAKFEVYIFSHSGDIRGSQNLKSRARDLGHAPFWPIFHFLVYLISPGFNPHAKFEICILSHSGDIRGSRNLKIRPLDLGHAPFDLIFIFLGLVSLCRMPNLRFVSSAVPEILGGSQNLKVGHVTQATLPYDLILYF